MRRGARPAGRWRCTRSATARTATRSTRSRRRATSGDRSGLRPRIEHAQLPGPGGRAAVRGARRRRVGAVLARAVRPRPRRAHWAEQTDSRVRVPLALGIGRRRRERLRRADRGARPACRHPRRRLRTIDERAGVASGAGAHRRSRRSRRRSSRPAWLARRRAAARQAAARASSPTSSSSTATRGRTSRRRSWRRWSAAAGCTTRRPGTERRVRRDAIALAAARPAAGATGRGRPAVHRLPGTTSRRLRSAELCQAQVYAARAPNCDARAAMVTRRERRARSASGCSTSGSAKPVRIVGIPLSPARDIGSVPPMRSSSGRRADHALERVEPELDRRARPAGRGRGGATTSSSSRRRRRPAPPRA